MSQTLQLSVHEVQFRITPTGTLFPLINFNSTKELEKMGIDSIAMPVLKDIEPYELGKGSRLKVKFEDEKMGYQPEILGIIKKASRISQRPSKCPSCDVLLVDDGEVIKCSNVYCAGQSRSMIYKMIKLVDPIIPIPLITTFLNNYSDGSATCVIDNIEEFKLLFSQIKHKKTQAREGHWLRLMPKDGAALWDLELKVDEFLHKKELPRSYFWSICNVPEITEPQVNEMNKLDPKKLLNLEYDIKGLNLSNKVERYIGNNLTFINFLNIFFESFGEKSWTN